MSAQVASGGTGGGGNAAFKVSGARSELLWAQVDTTVRTRRSLERSVVPISLQQEVRSMHDHLSRLLFLGSLHSAAQPLIHCVQLWQMPFGRYVPPPNTESDTEADTDLDHIIVFRT